MGKSHNPTPYPPTLSPVLSIIWSIFLLELQLLLSVRISGFKAMFEKLFSHNAVPLSPQPSHLFPGIAQ